MLGDFSNNLGEEAPQASEPHVVVEEAEELFQGLFEAKITVGEETEKSLTVVKHM